METPSSRYYSELVRVKPEKEPSSEVHDPVTKSQPKSTDGPDSGPDPKGHPSNHKLQPAPTPCASTGKRRHQGVGGSNKKKSQFGSLTRLWSDEDEIALLNGMIDFTNLKGRDPNAADDMTAFYNFVKGKLQAGVSKVQLGSKKRTLKSRFLNALDTGSDPVFSNPHEDMVFQLSKQIWGDCNRSNKKNIEGNSKEAAANQKEVAMEDSNGEEKTEFWSKYPALNESFHKMGNFSTAFSMSESGFSFVKERLSSIGSDKAKELDIKWRELIVKEMEIKSKQMEINDEMFALMTEQVKMAFDH